MKELDISDYEKLFSYIIKENSNIRKLIEDLQKSFKEFGTLNEKTVRILTDEYLARTVIECVRIFDFSYWAETFLFKTRLEQTSNYIM